MSGMTKNEETTYRLRQYFVFYQNQLLKAQFLENKGHVPEYFWNKLL